jgi:FecR protein
MSLRRPSLIRFALLTLAVLLLSISLPLRMQAQNACVLTPVKQNPTNRVLRCGRALTIQPAPGTVYVTGGGNGPPSSVQFGSGALLIDFHGSKAQRDFQVMTPEAIAAVRGTRWAMEVKPGLTSALGLAGAVQVARANNPADVVILRQGEGVDVSPTGEALQVKRWAPQRVQALLARFGQ